MKDDSRRVPFPKPDGYNAADWELLRRYVSACVQAESAGAERNASAAVHCQLGFPSCNVAPVPCVGPACRKADMNNCGGLSSDLIGGSWTYPHASYAERQAIWTAHLRNSAGTRTLVGRCL